MGNESLVISVLSPIISLGLLLINLRGYSSNKRTVQRGIMAQLVAEYSGSEMLRAMEALHRFRERHGGSRLEMKLDYDNQREKDFSRLDDYSPEMRAAFAGGTLHHYRRLVSHFYQRIQWLLKKKALTPEVVFSYWSSEEDLEKVLIKTIVPMGMDSEESFKDLMAMARKESLARLRWRWESQVLWVTAAIGLAGAVTAAVLLAG